MLFLTDNFRKKMMTEDDKPKPVETAAATEVKYNSGNAENLDMENRDPNHLNVHIAVSIYNKLYFSMS